MTNAMAQTMQETPSVSTVAREDKDKKCAVLRSIWLPRVHALQADFIQNNFLSCYTSLVGGMLFKLRVCLLRG